MMDQINLNLYIEQVNYNADTSGLEKWEEENVEQALSSVVDPNTEFKTDVYTWSSNGASPSDSYGLDVSSPNEEEEEEGFAKRRPKTQLHEDTQLARVHAYGASQSNTPNRKMQNISPADNEPVFSTASSLDSLQPDGTSQSHNNGSVMSTASIQDSMQPVHAFGILQSTNNNGPMLSTASSQVSMQPVGMSLSHSNGPVMNTSSIQDSLQPVHAFGTLQSTNANGPVMSTSIQDSLQTGRASGTSQSPNNIGPIMRTASSQDSLHPVHSFGTLQSPNKKIDKGPMMRTASSQDSLQPIHVFGTFQSPYKKVDNGPMLSTASSQDSLQPVMNSEHLTWILQRARDRLDTISNISGCSSRFELDSNCSEKMETMSTISDVSGYEEEMYRIKRLLLLDSAASTPTPTHSKIQKEKYDSTKSEWQEKYQDALRQKAHTEGRLETMRTEMLESRTQESALKAEVTKLQQALRELSAQLELKDIEVRRTASDSQCTEQENQRLRIQLQEIRIDVESKEGAITGLKNKVADQHVHMQELHQDKLKAENCLSSLQNELESMRKSNAWYRDQLHACQSAKLKIQQELMASQSSTVSLMHQLEKMKSESAGLRLVAEQTQMQAVREKEVLMRKLEAIQADMLEREATIIHAATPRADKVCEMSIMHSSTPRTEEQRCKTTITEKLPQLQELQEQISSLTLQLQAKEAIVKQMGSDNTELLTRLTVAQKMLNEKELGIQVLENKFRSTEMSQNQLIETLKTKEDALLEVRNEKVTAEVALAAAEREKGEVDAAVTKLRDDFARVTQSYKSMKEEVREKENKIINLTNKIKSIEKENTGLKSEANQYKEMQSQILQLRNYEAEIQLLTESNRELSNKVREITEANNYMKEMLAAREEQLLKQSCSLEVQHNEINSLQSELEEHKAKLEQTSTTNSHLTSEAEDLNIKISTLENNLTVARERLTQQQNEMELQNNEKGKLLANVQELEAYNANLSERTSSLQKQLESANAVIEQFNLLCRQSEEDRHQISDELKKVLKENATLKSTPENGVINNVTELCEKMELQLCALLSNGNVTVDLNHVCSKLIVMQELLSKVTNTEAQAVKNSSCTSQASMQSDLLISSDVGSQTESATNCVCNQTQTDNYASCVCNETQTDNEASCVCAESQTDIGFNCICAATQTECDNLELEMNITDSASCVSVTTQTECDNLERQVVNLKASLRMCELEHREKYRQYEANVHTLLKKVKEHLRGRKAAEKTLEDVKDCGEVARLNAELDELQRLLNKNQETILELEKERGKLVQTQDDALPAHKDKHITDLEEEIRKSHIIIKDLRKEVFSEKCEISQLKKQIASLQMGLETANDTLDARNVELGRSESVNSVMCSNINRLKKTLEAEEQKHEECRQELDKVRAELEESKAKDPVLADQLKTLSYHLHQKNQEIATLEEKLKLSEQRWQSSEKSLRLSIGALQDEISSLLSELDVLRKDKVTLQKHAAEMRTALHSSMENNKILRERLEKYECDNKDKMPDLTSSLPMPPVEYDETKIAELLRQSSLLPRSKPLSNLQACLDSLKQEMATLQQQLIAKAASASS